MNSASAENSRETGVNPSSSNWSSTSSSTTEGIPLPPTLIATFHTTNANNEIITAKKDEFPQPDLLLHKDQAMLVPHERKIPSFSQIKNRMDEVVERSDSSWTISVEEIKQDENKEKEEGFKKKNENDEIYNGTTKPVQVCLFFFYN
jgi:hypothetical protein